MSILLAIDPGNTKSAFVTIGEDLKPIWFIKMDNRESISGLLQGTKYDEVVIEQVASYGMPVGKEVFETCEWIGRYKQLLECRGKLVNELYRKDVKIHLCQSSRAGDTNIRRALIDRFAEHDLKNGKGTKGKPDWFNGFAADVWAAYALAVTYMDSKLTERSWQE